MSAAAGDPQPLRLVAALRSAFPKKAHRTRLPSSPGGSRTSLFEPETLMTHRAAFAALALAGSLIGVPALAASDTAPQVTAAPDVTDQIAAYLDSSPALEIPTDGPAGVTASRPDRQVHGEVSVSAGTNGYRSLYARSDMPVGKTGTLSIAVEDSSGGGRFGGGGARRQGLGIGLGFGDSTVSRGGDRCDADFRPRRGPPRGYRQATQFCGAEARDRAPMGAPD